MDGVADPRLLSEIKRALAQLPLVQPDGFKCRLHTVGPDHFLDLNLKVDPKLSVAAGHEIAEVVKESLKRKFPTLRDVVVHIEPYGTDSAAQISPT
jgi:divalent metal cation (Fe/Co/Zn/Cd) transporter